MLTVHIYRAASRHDKQEHEIHGVDNSGNPIQQLVSEVIEVKPSSSSCSTVNSVAVENHVTTLASDNYRPNKCQENHTTGL